jgi:DNA-binding LacI/PurR family transcriptional regulator
VGLEPKAALLYEGDWSATSGYQAVQHWRAQNVPFTAIFAQNDRMAVGAIRALHEIGKRVPHDVSVMGFDDIPLVSYFDPPLTTMRQDMAQIGREAARLLIRAVEQPLAIPQHLRLPAELIVRQSTRSL